jgi:hypothetical protein
MIFDHHAILTRTDDMTLLTGQLFSEDQSVNKRRFL